MTRDEARAVEHDCARHILDFYEAFDLGQYDRMAAMFTPQGVWHRAGLALCGPAIVAELEKRPATQRVRHVVTNVRVEAMDPERAQASFVITAYRGDASAPLPAGGLAGALWLVVRVQASLVWRDGQWAFASQSTQREFVFSG